MVLFRAALATVDVGTLISVGKAQVIGLNRILKVLSPIRKRSLFASNRLQHSTKPYLVIFDHHNHHHLLELYIIL